MMLLMLISIYFRNKFFIKCLKRFLTSILLKCLGKQSGFSLKLCFKTDKQSTCSLYKIDICKKFT